MMRNNETPRRASRHGGRQSSETQRPYYTLRESAHGLIGCLLQAFLDGTEALRERLDEVKPLIDGVPLPNRYGEILHALEQVAEQNLPPDPTTLEMIASAGGMERAELAILAEQASYPAMASHYAREVRRAYAREQIRSIASQIYNNPDSLPEALESVQVRNAINMLRDCAVPSAGDSEDDLIVPLAEWLAADPGQVEFLPFLGVDGLIARGTITLFGASPKGGGKTTVMVHSLRWWLQMGLKIVYLTEEPRAAWKLRLERFPELASPNLLVNAIPRANPYRWARAIEQIQPDVVVVDTIRRFLHAKDENDSASVAEALAPFVDLSRRLPRTAIILVHHTRKNFSRDVEIADIAGSHAFVAEADTVIALLPVAANKRQRVLVPLAGRLWASTPDPLVLELSEDGSTYAVKGIASEVLSEQKQADAKAKVLEAMEALREATVDEVREYLADTDNALARPTVYRALQELYAQGILSREGTGSKGDPYRFCLFVYSSTPLREETNRRIDE